MKPVSYQIIRTSLAAAAFAVAACGSVNDDGSGGEGTATDVVSPLDGFSVQFGDASGLHDTVTASDASADAVDEACQFAVNPAAREPGAPCTAGTDCDSGYCVQTAAGKVCTRTCVECCPLGFACAQLNSTDTVFLCLATQQALCRPCKTDHECGELSPDAICVGYGEQGRFCGGACDTDPDCPDGYACELRDGEKGAAKQCVSKSGMCACSPAATQVGAETNCAMTSSAGTCLGIRKCTADGLTACNAQQPSPELCDGLDNDCNGKTDDGFSGLEKCSGADDDCDGETDEPDAAGCVTLWVDADGDGHGQPLAKGGSAKCLCAPDLAHTATVGDDCDDKLASVSPTAPEACNNLDDDCDGKTDEGCDADKDGWCALGAQIVGLSAACTKGAGDCDDLDGLVYPGAIETCNGKDDDCDGETDEQDAIGCQPLFADADKDGFGTGPAACLCAPKGLYTAATSTDCDDTNALINPTAAEVCNNGADDNCDGVANEPNAKGCTDYFADKDTDGFGGGAAICLCGPSATHDVQKGNDCDDADKKVSPSATELCNGKDDDCNGKTDEQAAFGCVNHYADGDGDGFGDKHKVLCLCKPDGNYKTLTAGDCDDVQAAINPAAAEACDTIDNNCDGSTDEADAKGCKDHYTDADGDTFGAPASKQCLCKATADHTVFVGGDCDDKRKLSNPDAKESCSGFDDDCDGKTDEINAAGCKPYFKDGDGDAFGDKDDAVCLCGPTQPYTSTVPGDCNDNAKPVNPKAKEICDTIDNNCDGATDEQGATGCQLYYADNDKDGVGDGLAATRCLCAPKYPHAALKPGDCNDQDKTIYLLAPELCDGKDNDCDGITDEPGGDDCKDFYFDNDGDGWGIKGSKQCACTPIGQFTAQQAGDCHDNDKAINPDEKEQCDGKDNDCNGKTDDNVGNTLFYEDKDKDGWGVGAGKAMCKGSGLLLATKSGDCDDNDAARHPLAAEVCDDKDNNCNGSTDEGGVAKKLYFRDVDGDGWGVTGDTKTLCVANSPYTALKGGDCADGDKFVNPAQAEVQCNKKDDDCKGGDACQQCTGLCNGKCNSTSPAGTATRQECFLYLGFLICVPTDYTCYCDSLCATLGDCCPSRPACCS